MRSVRRSSRVQGASASTHEDRVARVERDRVRVELGSTDEVLGWRDLRGTGDDQLGVNRCARTKGERTSKGLVGVGLELEGRFLVLLRDELEVVDFLVLPINCRFKESESST